MPSHAAHDPEGSRQSQEASRVRRDLTVQVLRVLNRSGTMVEGIRDVLAAITDLLDIEAAGVRLAQGDDYPYYRTTGLPAQFVELENRLCQADGYGQAVRDEKGNVVLECLCGHVLRGQVDSSLPCFTEAGSFWTNCSSQLVASIGPGKCPPNIRGRCITEGYESMALIPIRGGDGAMRGLLQLCDRRRGRLSADLIHVLEGIGENIGVALTRRAIEEKSAALAARDEAILAAVPDMLMEVDTNLVYTWANAAGREFFGEGVVGQEAAAYFVGAQDSTERARPLLEGSEEVLYIESLQRRKDGQHRLLAWWCRTLKDSDGKVIGALSTGRDITDQRHSQQEAASLLRWLTQAQAVGHIGTFEHSLVDESVVWSDELCRICEIPLENRPLHDNQNLALVHPDDRQLQQAQARELIEKGQSEFEYRIITPGGNTRWICGRGQTEYDADGKPVRVFGTVQDVTDRHRLEQQLIQAQKMEAIGRLAGGIAHDFRNQLTIIKGFGELLLRSANLAGDDQDQLRQILAAADKSARMTSQLLAFGRKELLQPTVVNLSEAVDEVGKTLPQMVGEDIRLRLIHDERPCLARIDRSQFQQALLNLAANARDAMPDGGELCIETRRERGGRRTKDKRPDPSDCVVVAISDTGCGMDEKTLAMLFEPFFTTKPVGRGTGLGLAMVYGFVKQSSGEIDVASRPGEGAVFTLRFPRERETPPEAPAAPDTTPLPCGHETIMVVEDEDAVREAVATLLRNLGYVVLDIADAEEALAIIHGRGPQIDLLITDIVMHGLNGKDMAKSLRQAYPHMPILLMSGYDHDDFAPGQTAAAFCDDLLVKPISQPDLARVVRRLLDQ
ncbi:MAG: response regulator [Planctomycetaceae bacterium]|nr:response regulator [Planctomycetaceae bacterium]